MVPNQTKWGLLCTCVKKSLIQTSWLLMYHVNLAGGLDQSDEQLATTKSSNLYAELKLYINGSD